MGDGIRRLRRLVEMPGFAATLDLQGIAKNRAASTALATAIRRLRTAANVPLPEDVVVELPGQVFLWAHAIASQRWLYYRIEPGDDERVVLLAVHDHLHEQ